MKKRSLCLLLILCLGFAPACETDFDVAAQWKEIAVVYGLLDVSEPTQYIRIQKAFLDENVSALDIAQQGDSLFLQSTPTVTLKVFDQNGNARSDIALELVDAATAGIVKEEGIFANSPHFLYKTDQSINSDFTYQIEIITSAGQNIKANTAIVDDFRIVRPNPAIATIGFLSGFDLNMIWEARDDASIYDLDIFINFRETRIENEALFTELRTIKWNAFSNFQPENSANNNTSFSIPAEQFFDLLVRELEGGDNLQQRDQITLDFVFHAGSEQLKIFNDVALAQFGITSSQGVLTYTNVENGLGLFASRYSKTVSGNILSPESQKELACSDFTRHLKFVLPPSSIDSGCN